MLRVLLKSQKIKDLYRFLLLSRAKVFFSSIFIEIEIFILEIEPIF